jgi:uncharacterized protein (TIGR02145 family)
MKKIIFLCFIAVTVLYSCSKKSEPNPGPDSIVIEGTAYPTVAIGTMTWTSQNYDGPGGVYYNNNASNSRTNGKLYTFSEANAVQLPAGWRLPNQNDYSYLIYMARSSGHALMSKSGWTIGGGIDSLGFNAIPVGYEKEGMFTGQSYYAVFITPTVAATVPGLGTFAVFQGNYSGGTYTYAFLTDILTDSTDRGSLRFVKDN